ncbi:MAG: chemotaxis protein CheA [Nitrospirae bacterium]|nr:chemotaxis protein CheA [Nitrospirota bacterium]
MSSADKHKETYREEAYELLADLEVALLELEKSPDNGELIGRAFRDLHTIKGSGAMFGFEGIAAFTHEVETVFDLVRDGRMPVTKDLIDLTLSARDHIRNLLDLPETDHNAAGGEILTPLRKLVPRDAEETGTGDSASGHAGDNMTYRIQFRPGPDIFKKGINPSLLLNELRTLGPCRALAYTDSIPKLNSIDPETCYTYWDIMLTTDKGINAVKDVFIFVEEDCKLIIEEICDAGKFGEKFADKKVGEILIERGFVTQGDLASVLGQQRRIGEMLIETNMVSPRKVEAALAEQQHIREIRQKEQQNDHQADTPSSIRVASGKLDSLVNLVGEMVTVQARLSRLSAFKNDPVLLSVAEEVERLTGELRDQTMSIRMLPIGTTFSKFKRLVRDLSKELGKEIELTTEGAETELDKTVIEKLNDPMVHLIRNCIDHAIEPPDIRSAVGKPAQGMVHLSARHSGAYVLIEIIDDGAGLDADAIRAKAIEKGLITPDDELTEKEIYSLILAPGFSTAKTVTNVSGRGVGMDVVKRAIDNLRGSIGISSQKGIGTTITLKLPLTLAIIEGLLVNIGKEYFVLPLAVVEECVELARQDAANAHGRHLANVRGQIVPYIRLREQFIIQGEGPEIEQIVIAGVEGHRVGFVVDSVVGEHQTVIKTLGRIYKDIDGISGATILGDGTVALILDIQRLTEIAEHEEMKAQAGSKKLQSLKEGDN